MAVHHFITPERTGVPACLISMPCVVRFHAPEPFPLCSPTLVEAPRRERGQCGCKSCRRDHFLGPDATADRHPTFNRTLVRLQLPPGSPLILPCRPTVGQRTLNPPMMVRIHLGQPFQGRRTGQPSGARQTVRSTARRVARMRHQPRPPC